MRSLQHESPPAPRSTCVPPEPARGEVRVRLCWLRVVADPRDDACLGDGAGVIDAIGDGVPPQRLGLPVWLLGSDRRHGAQAIAASPYVVLPSARAIALPDDVPMDAGACLAGAALTAMHAVLVDGGVTGKRVLIDGAATPVGHYALQFARLAGAAQVLARVGDALGSGIALDAGAHATLIGDDDERSRARIDELTEGNGVDRVIEADGSAMLGPDVLLLRDDGDIVVHGCGALEIASLPLAGAMRKNLRLRFVDATRIGDAERGRALWELQAWLERGLIRHHVDARLPLARIGEAASRLRHASAGSVLVSID